MFNHTHIFHYFFVFTFNLSFVLVFMDRIDRLEYDGFVGHLWLLYGLFIVLNVRFIDVIMKCYPDLIMF
jgi:hypothetical protein